MIFGRAGRLLGLDEGVELRLLLSGRLEIDRNAVERRGRIEAADVRASCDAGIDGAGEGGGGAGVDLLKDSVGLLCGGERRGEKSSENHA